MSNSASPILLAVADGVATIRQVVERRAPVEAGPRVGVEQRPVGLERAVLDGEGEVLGARRQPTPGPDVVGASR